MKRKTSRIEKEKIMNDQIFWSPGTTLEQIEKQVILKAHAHFKTKIATAIALGVSERTITNKLNQYDEEKRIQDEQLMNERRAREDLLLKARGMTPTMPSNVVNVIAQPVELPMETKKAVGRR